MDKTTRKAWGVVAAAGLTVYVVAKAMLRPKSKRTGSVVGIVEGGRDPHHGQVYGRRRSASHTHRGIDVDASVGAGVYAAGDGRVAARWPDGVVRGYGNSYVIQHPDGTQTLYAHLDKFAAGIKRGGMVRQGQLIGYVGQTQKPRAKMVSAPHLHFETHLAHTLRINEHNPQRMDPMEYLADRGLGVQA